MKRDQNSNVMVLVSPVKLVKKGNQLITCWFLNLCRCMAKRRINSICSDNCKNFEGAKNELQQRFNEIKWDKIKSLVKIVRQENGAHGIVWHNSPLAIFHISGVWEHQIWPARTILERLLKTHSHSLYDELLRPWS